MFGSDMLETALGMVFIYLLVSLIVSATTELIASWRKWRADNLWLGIKNLLDAPEAKDWANKVYNHTLIKGLSPLKNPAKRRFPGLARVMKSMIWPDAKGPSYIPSRTFALTLVDLVGRSDPSIRSVATALQNALDTIPDSGAFSAGKKNELKKAISDIKDLGAVGAQIKADIDKLIDGLPEEGRAAAVKADVQSFLDKSSDRYIGAVIKNLPDSEMKQALQVLLDEAEGKVESLKTHIEIWFNNSMDRVSGWYKRKTQLVHLLLAIGLTIGLNVDSVLVVKAISQNPALRQALVAQAEKFAEQPPVQLRELPAPTPTPTPTPDPQASGGQQPAGGARASGITLSENEIRGGDSVSGTVTLGTPQPGQDTTVKLTTSDEKLAGVTPASVTLNESQPSAGFSVNTVPVATGSKITIRSEQTRGGAVVANDSVDLKVNDSPEAKFRVLRDQLNSIGLPVGWIRRDGTSLLPIASGPESVQSPDKVEVVDATYRTLPKWPWEDGQTFGGWLSMWFKIIRFHFFGWTLTAIAVSLGAPFWFDMLNKIITIRSSGKAPEEKPKAPKDVPTPLEPGQSPREADRVNSRK